MLFFFAMIPKADGDSTPLGQRPLCVLPVVYRLWAFGLVIFGSRSKGGCLSRFFSLGNGLSVDRYTSHVIFLMHLAHVITLTSWFKVSQCAFHSIHTPSMMLHV